jgi:hypothetical protein
MIIHKAGDLRCVVIAYRGYNYGFQRRINSTHTWNHNYPANI